MKNFLKVASKILIILPALLKGLIALGITVALIFAFFKFNDVRACFSDLVGCFGPGIELGGFCNFDTDCKGWKASGTIACCGEICSTKDFSIQTCSAFISGEGKPCDAPHRTIWPMSGCDASAGLCCNGSCAKSCPVPQGEECILDADCEGWNVSSLVACCESHCVTKMKNGQTCNALFHGKGSACSTPNGTIWPASGCDVSAGICCNGQCATSCGRAQGDSCTIDADCSGWSLTGRIACCDNICVSKDSSAQRCSEFTRGKGKACIKPDGTVWPFSGCDASAGICCKGQCSTSCP